jgi:hypothetical protein
MLKRNAYAFKIPAVILTIDEARRLGLRSERSIGLVSREASTYLFAVGTGLNGVAVFSHHGLNAGVV